MLAASLHQARHVDESALRKLICADALMENSIAALGQLTPKAFDLVLAETLSDAFATHGTTAQSWVCQLLNAGVAAAQLRSMIEVRASHKVEEPDFHTGATFQFSTDLAHPIGGPVTMFAPCSIRAPGAHMPLPLSPAPKYGQHTREVLQEVGLNPESLLECGATVEGWSQEYLPAYAAAAVMLQSGAASPSNADFSCPVCLRGQQASAILELSCGHQLCKTCAKNCSSFGHGKCPVCRHPHLLDPAVLAQRSSEWRRDYMAFRKGGAKGAAGELTAIGNPNIQSQDLRQHQKWTLSAGDLSELGRTVELEK